jgi:hypothetical protein
LDFIYKYITWFPPDPALAMAVLGMLGLDYWVLKRWVPIIRAAFDSKAPDVFEANQNMTLLFTFIVGYNSIYLYFVVKSEWF